MSTNSLEGRDGPATCNTSVWRTEDAKLRLLVLHGEGFAEVWFTSDRRIVSANGIRGALALVIPSAVGTPDTTTDSSESRRASLLPVIAGLAALLASLSRFGSPRVGPHRDRRRRHADGVRAPG